MLQRTSTRSSEGGRREEGNGHIAICLSPTLFMCFDHHTIAVQGLVVAPHPGLSIPCMKHAPVASHTSRHDGAVRIETSVSRICVVLPDVRGCSPPILGGTLTHCRQRSLFNVLIIQLRQ